MLGAIRRRSRRLGGSWVKCPPPLNQEKNEGQGGKRRGKEEKEREKWERAEGKRRNRKIHRTRKSLLVFNVFIKYFLLLYCSTHIKRFDNVISNCVCVRYENYNYRFVHFVISLYKHCLKSSFAVEIGVIIYT